MQHTLWEAELDTGCAITHLACTGPMRRRLMDLGFVEGEQVRKLLQNRGMAAYLVRGTLIALRRGDAKKILIQ